MLRVRQTWPRRKLLLMACLASSLVTVAWRGMASLHVWAAGNVPVAFWVWGNELPTEGEVERAERETKAHVLFVRAGQLHVEGGRVLKVRSPAGKFPQSLSVHLVYNGTHALLNSFEEIETGAFAAALIDTYRVDLERAGRDGARVTGLQLDLDVPTRLLPRYAQLLRALRSELPPGMQLSVTGLPTWMSSRALVPVLDAVDFWVPQFYGARIPETLNEIVSVSSAAQVAADVAHARALQRPFYAGVAAYGYAALYSKSSALVELRGDLDPALVARDSNLELVERRAFDADAGRDSMDANVPETATASEWRYVFRARVDASVGGLFMREGEQLMLDVPSSASLRASLRAVREGAGERLLGVCLFRLPTAGDSTALTLAQIVAALADQPTINMTTARLERTVTNDSDAMNGSDTTQDKSFDVRLRNAALDESARVETSQRVRLIFSNDGDSSALLSDALTVTVGVPAGSLRGISKLKSFADVETLCGDVARGDALEPCGARRASAVRFVARAWSPGAKALAVLSVGGALPQSLPVAFVVRVDDGRIWRREGQMLIEGGRGMGNVNKGSER